MRKKPILLRLLPWIIVLVLIAGAYIVLDKIYSSPGHSFARDPKILTYDGDGKPLALSSLRGKPVLVHFWATWCMPCREAHKILEPMKADRLKDVSFVYVTNPTSPLPKWKEMIENINGDHYYLTKEQFDAIFKQIEANGYPTYLIVGKDGTILNKHVGYDSNIPDELEKALK